MARKPLPGSLDAEAMARNGSQNDKAKIAKLEAEVAQNIEISMISRHERFSKAWPLIAESDKALSSDGDEEASENTLEEISARMKDEGFRRDEPLVVWKHEGERFLVDGHRRFEAAKKAGLTEVPVIVMDREEYKTEQDVLRYIYERQRLRRNITPYVDAKLLEWTIDNVVQTNNVRFLYPEGSIEKAMTRCFPNLSQKKAERAKRVATSERKDLIKDVLSGEMSINQAYNTIVGSASSQKKVEQALAETGAEERHKALQESEETAGVEGFADFSEEDEDDQAEANKGGEAESEKPETVTPAASEGAKTPPKKRDSSKEVAELFVELRKKIRNAGTIEAALPLLPGFAADLKNAGKLSKKDLEAVVERLAKEGKKENR